MWETNFGLWVGFWGLAIGTVIFGARAFANRREQGVKFHFTSFVICLWATMMYMTMIQGLIVYRIYGQVLYWGRYVDWAVTTPLLLWQVGAIAGARPKLIAGVMAVDLFMIITGLIASIVPAYSNLFWFVVSCGAGLAILWVLMTNYRAAARGRSYQLESVFIALRGVLIAYWSIYPFVWILGTEAIHFFGIEIENVVYALLDVSAKVVFGLYLTSRDIRLLAEASNPSSPE